MKTRPVRLPPCAAGASPTRRIRAVRVAEARHRPAPVRLVAEARDLLARDLLAPLDEPRAAPALDDLRGQRARGPLDPRRAIGYFSSSLSSRRDVTTSPMRPMTARYATWTSRTGEMAPTESERMRSTPW